MKQAHRQLALQNNVGWRLALTLPKLKRVDGDIRRLEEGVLHYI